MTRLTGSFLEASIVLVGTQIDLRDDSAVVEKLKAVDAVPVSTAMGESLATKINASRY